MEGRREAKIKTKPLVCNDQGGQPDSAYEKAETESTGGHCFEDHGHLVVPGRSAAYALSRRLSEVVTYRSVCAFI